VLCAPCGRYIKALDTRNSTRPLMPYVDVIATLPLDAAVMKSQNE
jgi:formate dehydrogenase maturation protein FdhE